MPALVNGTFTQGSAAAGGGTAIWANTAGADSPLTGAFPARDYLYLPSNVTYFSAIPTGASVDGQYLATMADAANPRGPSEGYVAGLWLNRGSAASLATNNAPVLIHGTTNVASRYTALATNPFSRSDFERIWGWVVQSALWSNLTDEAKLDQTITVDTLGDRTFGDPDFVVHATATSGRTVTLAASGDCTLDGPTAPATLHLTGAGAAPSRRPSRATPTTTRPRTSCRRSPSRRPRRRSRSSSRRARRRTARRSTSRRRRPPACR